MLEPFYNPVQRPLLADSRESHKHFAVERERRKKTIASHSMTKRWKLICACSSNPVVCLFARCFLFSFPVVPNSASGFSSERMFPQQLRGHRIFWALLTSVARPDLSTNAILRPPSFCLCTLVFRIGFGLSGRNVVPDFKVCSCSSFVPETFAIEIAPRPIFPQLSCAAFSLWCFPMLTPLITGLLVTVLGLAVLLLGSALSVDVASQCLRSYFGLRKRLDISDTFLERSLSLLLWFLQQVWLLRITCTKCRARDIIHVAERHRIPFEVFFKISFWKSRVSCFGVSCRIVCGICCWIAHEVPLAESLLPKTFALEVLCVSSTVLTLTTFLTVCVRPRQESWRMSLPCRMALLCTPVAPCSS